MAGVPTNFQAFSDVLASYNFVDIASGTGYVSFYGGNTVDVKVLSNFIFYSDLVSTSYAFDKNSAASLILDVDHDVMLNRPLNIKGIGIVNLPVSIAYVNTSASMYAIVLLRKWDGITETDIVNNQSRVLSSINGINYTMLGIDLTVPLTHFKIGEYMRLTVRIYATGDTVNNGIVAYGNDPKSRTAGWDTTGAVPSQLMFQCPVRLNL